MNDLTYNLLTELGKKYKKQAEKNDADFRFIVYNAYCDRIVETIAADKMLRACRLWRAFHPEHFDDSGYLLDYEPSIYDIELVLSDIVMRLTWRIVERSPELKLDEWSEVPQAEVQLKLF